MKIPVSSRIAGAASTTGIRYAALAGGGIYVATAGQNASPSPIGGTISNLYVRAGPTLTAGSYTIVLMVNGSPSSLTAAVTSGNSTANDTSNSVAFSAGDLLEWRITAASSPDALTSLAISAEFESGVARSSAMFSGHRSNAVDYFMPPGGRPDTAAEAFATGVMAVAGDYTHMRVNLTTAPGAGVTRTYTLRKNGVDTGLTVAIADSATSGTGTSTVSFVAGDKVTIGLVITGGTAAASQGNIGLTWEPTTNGYFPLLSVATTAFATTGTKYMPGSGTTAGNQATETNTPTVSPSAMTVDMMYAEVSDAPGAAASGKQRAFTLRTDITTDTALVATIFETAIDNQDTTHSASITAGQLLTISQVPTNTPASPTTYNRVGMRGFITPTDGATTRRSMTTLGVG